MRSTISSGVSQSTAVDSAEVRSVPLEGLQSGIHDYVFLPAARSPDLAKQVPHVDPVEGSGGFSVPRERRMHTGVAERKRPVIRLNRPVPQRAHQVLGGIVPATQVATVLPVLQRHMLR